VVSDLPLADGVRATILLPASWQPVATPPRPGETISPWLRPCENPQGFLTLDDEAI